MVKLRFNSQYIEIECERGDTESISKIMQIPHVHNNRTNTIFKTTLRNIGMVLKMFRDVDVYDMHSSFYVTAPQVIVDYVETEMRRRRATKELIELGPTEDAGFLMRHQQLGREIAQVNDRFAFFYDTRTGKTPMSLQIIYDDVKANPGHKWLVLCPLILIENAWIPDAAEFFPDLKVVSLHASTRAKRLKQFELEADVYVMNIEAFVTFQAEVEKLGIHGAFVDESSTMKSSSSKFAKAAVDFAYKCKRWYLLSGTPAPNGEYEYYRQLQSVDYYMVPQSYSKFEAYFFNNVSHNPQYKKLAIKPERQDELHTLLRGVSLFVDKEEVLETPGRDFITYPLEMPDNLKKAYKELKKTLALQLGDATNITAPSEAAKLNKLNQLTSGFIMDTEAVKHNKYVSGIDSGRIHDHVEDGYRQEIHYISEYRFDALDKLLEELGDEQAIIWCNYHGEFDIIKDRLGESCGLVNGKVSIAEKNANIKAFKEGKIKYLVANPASADKGLTLTNAHIAIYFSLNYSYELYKQSIERIYGSILKQPKRCKYYIFTATGTVDEVIYGVVSTKGIMSTAVLNYLKGGQ